MHTLDGFDGVAATNENDTSFVADSVLDLSIFIDRDSDVVSSDYCEEQHKHKKRCLNAIMHFCSQHPLLSSHGMRYITNNAAHVPNFVGANLPRCNQGDWEYYCHTMLVLFKPWRKGTDLKAADQLWDDAFQDHSFSKEQLQYICNFNVCYECLDARDDYRAQMKKTGNGIIGSWVVNQDEEVENKFQDVSPDDTAFDDTPTIPGVTWEQEIETLKQKVQDKKSEHYTSQGPSQKISETSHKLHVANVVKVVDKSYFKHDFCIEGESDLIDSTVKDFSLNGEQERALRIIVNHAISLDHDQLQMYLGGDGRNRKVTDHQSPVKLLYSKE